MTFEPKTLQQLGDFLCGKCHLVPHPDCVSQCRECQVLLCTSCIFPDNLRETNCPSCDKYMETSSSAVPKAIKSALLQLQISCPFAGCEFIARSSDYRKHIDSCELNPDRRFPCQTCGTKIAKINVENHKCVFDLRELVEELKSEIAEQIERKQENDTEMQKVRDTLRNLEDQIEDKLKIYLEKTASNTEQFAIEFFNRKFEEIRLQSEDDIRLRELQQNFRLMKWGLICLTIFFVLSLVGIKYMSISNTLKVSSLEIDERFQEISNDLKAIEKIRNEWKFSEQCEKDVQTNTKQINEMQERIEELENTVKAVEIDAGKFRTEEDIGVQENTGIDWKNWLLLLSAWILRAVLPALQIALHAVGCNFIKEHCNRRKSRQRQSRLHLLLNGSLVISLLCLLTSLYISHLSELAVYNCIMTVLKINSPFLSLLFLFFIVHIGLVSEDKGSSLLIFCWFGLPLILAFFPVYGLL